MVDPQQNFHISENKPLIHSLKFTECLQYARYVWGTHNILIFSITSEQSLGYGRNNIKHKYIILLNAGLSALKQKESAMLAITMGRWWSGNALLTRRHNISAAVWWTQGEEWKGDVRGKPSGHLWGLNLKAAVKYFAVSPWIRDSERALPLGITCETLSHFYL